ncbi:MAG: terminase family protein [Bacteroidales bacterium]|nr:terminase family protein [Bacteroidales bacterium]MCC8119884.1 terminase family protein [Bacteroidales bacterium]
MPRAKKTELPPESENPNVVLDNETIERYREENLPTRIIAQKGGQEKILSSCADVIIGGGCRGGAKTFTLLMEALYDIYNPNFKAVLLRHEIEDLSDMVETSDILYHDFGEYNRSKSDMRWNFYTGGFLKFSYHADSIEDFKKRFQGKQFSYIGVDEITHMEFEKFKYLLSTNRNAYGIRNRFIGTCNPDPDSWVAKFIDWWIGEDGLPIPERDGVVRYFFNPSDDAGDIIWGDTRQEVYEQCRDIIDPLYEKNYKSVRELANVSPARMFVKSATFIEAKLRDNKKLLLSDPGYLANLANQSEEMRARDLDGNWKFRSVGDDMIKLLHMENFYQNAEQTADGVRRVSLDAAFEGGDSLVMILWIGWHIKDVFVCRLDSKSTVNAVKAKLQEWGVQEENFTYDLNGIGQVFKGFFPNAIAFNNREAVAKDFKDIYSNLKSQAAYTFAQRIINREMSIEPTLLTRKYSGKGFSNMALRDILNKERKAIRKDNNAYDKGWSLIKKADMKKIVGHSPDYIEAMLMRSVFDLKKRRCFRGLGLL